MKYYWVNAETVDGQKLATSEPVTTLDKAIEVLEEWEKTFFIDKAWAQVQYNGEITSTIDFKKTWEITG